VAAPLPADACIFRGAVLAGWSGFQQSGDHGMVVTFPTADPAEPGPGAECLARPPLFAALASSRSVLIAGAGGGFDVYAGLPLAIALWDAGVQVHLANLSFTQLELLDLHAWAAPDVAAVMPDTAGPRDYFPERTLARCTRSRRSVCSRYGRPTGT
jgi:hypothetical protein